MTDEGIFDQIVIKNASDEKRFSKFACKSYKGKRKHPELEKPSDKKDIRPIFHRDADKIIHSHAYSRYIDKTQVFFLFKNDHVTHRVLHVQLVSKIGRVIGRALGLNEDLIEAIALGHDIGHVPYGHKGEKFLDEICRKYGIGYFCHNAQSVRFLNEIENKGKGLNLTLQVVDGILSHNGEMLSREYKPQLEKTWSEFDKEYNSCFKSEDYSKRLFPMTLEGCVVRIADVISYVGRDIEDAITVELIKRADIPDEIARILGNNNREIIDVLVKDLVWNSYGQDRLLFSELVYDALKRLIDFNYKHIYHHELLLTQDDKIRNMFKIIFKRNLDDLITNNDRSTIFKHYLKKMDGKYRINNKPERIVIDFIAGMTDDFFNDQFSNLLFPKRFKYTISELN